jgi:hypothetical protein
VVGLPLSAREVIGFPGPGGAGPVNPAAVVGPAETRLAGGGAYGGMPYMPMSPMTGNGHQERERTTWLLEDRPVWCAAGTVAPRVVHSGVTDDGDLEVIPVTGETDVPVPVAPARPRQPGHATAGSTTYRSRPAS